MRALISREAWFCRAAMIRSPTITTTTTLHHFCTCSLHLHPFPARELYSIRDCRLTPPTSAMLDQAQRARMARNREQALYRLHNKRHSVNKPVHDASRFPLYYGGGQLSSLPGVTDFLHGPRDTMLNNQQDTRGSQHQCSLLSASKNGVLENHVNVPGVEVVVGETNVVTQKIQELGPVSSIRSQEFDYVVVIDFEATCDKNMEKLKPQEIIEFPAVLVDCRRLTVGDCFQTYVRPVHHPILTTFCTHLTGIQQEQVDKGIPLAEAIYWHDKWLERNGIKNKNFAVLIWSDWDCKIMLESECKLKGLDKPHYFNRWINLKVLFQGAFNGRKCNLRKAVEVSGLKWTGRAHCGLDDAMNTARLALELMRRGTILTVTGSLDSEALVTKIRRPEWPRAISQEAIRETSNGSDVQSSNGSVNKSLNMGINTLQCFCGVTCKRHTVKKPGPTHGKNFFACGRWTPTEGCRCGFFEWAIS
eukprot:c18885_g1_i1 orf=115-1539(-)